jgi:hypothetical protein
MLKYVVIFFLSYYSIQAQQVFLDIRYAQTKSYFSGYNKKELINKEYPIFKKRIGYSFIFSRDDLYYKYIIEDDEKSYWNINKNFFDTSQGTYELSNNILLKIILTPNKSYGFLGHITLIFYHI